MADVGGTMSDVSAPVRRVLLISAGASHSVALLCKLFVSQPFMTFFFSLLFADGLCTCVFIPTIMDPHLGLGVFRLCSSKWDLGDFAFPTFSFSAFY